MLTKSDRTASEPKELDKDLLSAVAQETLLFFPTKQKLLHRSLLCFITHFKFAKNKHMFSTKKQFFNKVDNNI